MRNVMGFIVVLSLFACTGNKKTGGNDVPEQKSELPYHLDLKEVMKDEGAYNLSVLGDQISYIPLESTSASVLKTVHSYLFLENTLLVTDRTNLCRFDEKGRFIQTIGKKGQGPQDHISIFSLTKSDASDRFYVHSLSKIIVYNKDAKYEKSISTTEPDLFMMSAVTTPENQFFIYQGSQYKMPNDTTTIYSFLTLDTLGQVVKRIPNTNPLIVDYPGMIIGQVPSYRYKNEIHFMDYGNDTVFTSLNGEIKPYAICRLDGMKREINTANLRPDQYSTLDDKLLVSDVCEDEHFLYITLRWGLTDKYQYVLYNKVTDELLNVGSKGLVNDLDGGIPFFPERINEDGTMVMSIDAESFLEKVESIDFRTQKERYGEDFEEFRKLASRIKPDDNPVFILVKRR